ncbi:hypothetical protein C2G38_2251731 [Gigaspora rosea]|uniref:BTB domain-containing protein n=1 Tax=Gigaspora rosea TaxID=44941 RepID=A0A397UFE1_9GLOM|nr:hypothetical protein C2G38_2251731 [Gigaspora rosea]
MTFFNYSETHRKDLYQLLHNSNDYNVMIQVGKEPDIEIFNAHSNILCARSSYFKTALSERWANYMYILDLTDQSPSNVLALLIASDELNLDELVQCSQEHKNPLGYEKILPLLYTHSTSTKVCEKLCQHLKYIFYLDPEPFFNSEDLLNLDRDILFEFIQSDFLTVKEIDLWNFLLKWAKSSQFYDNVRPYKALIPSDLYESSENYFITKRNHILRPRCGSLHIDSVLIDKYKAAVIIKWVEKRDFFVKKPSYQFELIYKATHGEFNPTNFIKSCSDHCGAVLVLIKVSNSSKIIGGYNPLGLKVTYLTLLPQWDQTSDR